MDVVNIHRRRYAAPPDRVGELLDSLSSADDRLWPHQAWPAMRFDAPLGVGARGGHGPIRYHVVAYVPGRHVRFQFDAPRGFDGWHELTVAADGDGSVLTHALRMRAHGLARLSWPLLFRPLHDALVEDALDRADAALGESRAPSRWSLRVRCLRRVAVLLMNRRRRLSGRRESSTPA